MDLQPYTFCFGGAREIVSFFVVICVCEEVTSNVFLKATIGVLTRYEKAVEVSWCYFCIYASSCNAALPTHIRIQAAF